MSENKKYWEFKMQANNEADLYLYIEIAWWGGGYSAHSAQSFKDELDSLGNIDILNIYINSPGGDVFEGNTIFNMLTRKKYTKNVYIDGVAASIASIIAMAGDKIIMPSNSMMMIHNARGGVYGTSEEMRNQADLVDRLTENARTTYVDRSNGKLDLDTVTELMNNETWLTAQECYDYGLCDEIVGAKQVVARWNGNFFNAQNYKNVPNTVLKMTVNEKTVSPMDEATKILIQRIKNI